MELGEGITIEDTFRRHGVSETSMSDVMIYGRLEYSSLDSDGNLIIAFSKDNKSFLAFLVRFLQDMAGKECSTSIRFRD